MWYQAVYSKPRGAGWPAHAWFGAMSEAAAFAKRFERVGYRVDIWAHDENGARPVNRKENR